MFKRIVLSGRGVAGETKDLDSRFEHRIPLQKDG